MDPLNPTALQTKLLSQVANLTSGNLTGTTGGTLMGYSLTAIVLSFFFSLVGLLYFKQGRKQGNTIKLACGVGLLAFTMFVKSTLWISLIGIGLVLIPFKKR